MISHYNPSVRIMTHIASHTTHAVCVNFIYEQWDLQFKVDSKRQIFEKHYMAILFLPEICREQIAEEIFSY